MKPELFWKIGIIILLAWLIQQVLSVIKPRIFPIGLVEIILIAFSLVALIFFALKNKAGYFFAYIIAAMVLIFGILSLFGGMQYYTGAAHTLSSVSSSVSSFVSSEDLKAATYYFLAGGLSILGSIILFLSIRKSKQLFFEKK